MAKVQTSLKGQPVEIEYKSTSPGFYDVFCTGVKLGNFYNQTGGWWYASLNTEQNGEKYFSGRSLPTTKKNGGTRNNCALYVAQQAYRMGLLQPLLTMVDTQR